MKDFDDVLDIPVLYKGEELSFSGKLILTGFTPKMQVDVNSEIIIFEPDEEGNYRAILTNSQILTNQKYDIPLLIAIAGVINSVT